MGLALGLCAVSQAGQEEEQVVDVTQELLALAGELEGGLVLQDAGGETQEARQPVVLNGPILLVQDLTAGGTEVTTKVKEVYWETYAIGKKVLQ